MKLYQANSFCTARYAINKMKRQLIKWENIFANNVCDEGSM